MTVYRYHLDHTEPYSHQVFVYGSNTAGRNGKGAALYAKQRCDAIYGVGSGISGRSYAIPTKDDNLRVLEIDAIIPFILQFKQFALQHHSVEFFVTRVGCGLAGYNDCDIAPWFRGSNDNCVFPIEWEPYLSNQRLNELYTLCCS